MLSAGRDGIPGVLSAGYSNPRSRRHFRKAEAVGLHLGLTKGKTEGYRNSRPSHLPSRPGSQLADTVFRCRVGGSFRVNRRRCCFFRERRRFLSIALSAVLQGKVVGWSNERAIHSLRRDPGGVGTVLGEGDELRGCRNQPIGAIAGEGCVGRHRTLFRPYRCGTGGANLRCSVCGCPWRY